MSRAPISRPHATKTADRWSDIAGSSFQYQRELIHPIFPEKSNRVYPFFAIKKIETSYMRLEYRFFSGRASALSAGGLQRLAAAIEAAKGRHQEGRKVDIGEEMSSRENTEQVIRNAKDTSPQPLSRQSASAGTSCRASRSAGRAGPSDAAQGEEDRGGGEP
jgi:hypothetical protein